jgi:putative ABC transport system permease protein
MVRYEGVITAVIGGLLGTAVGLLFAFLVTQSLDDLGLGFAPPLGQLALFLLLAVAVGIIAAIVPARRGARMQVLEGPARRVGAQRLRRREREMLPPRSRTQPSGGNT